MTGKKPLIGFGLLLCGTDATTISKAKKPCTAVTSSYDVNALLSCFLILHASATFSAIKMASQMSTMIPSLGGRWLKHLSKEWLGLQSHKFCTSFPRLQALQSTANLRTVMSYAQQITRLSTLKQTMSHIPSA